MVIFIFMFIFIIPILFTSFNNSQNNLTEREDLDLKSSSTISIIFYLCDQIGDPLNKSDLYPEAGLFVGSEGTGWKDFGIPIQDVNDGYEEIWVYDKRFNLLIFYENVNFSGKTSYDILCNIGNLTINLDAREIGYFTIASQEHPDHIYPFNMNPNTTKILTLGQSLYSATWLNTEDDSLHEYNFNMDSNKEITLNSIYYDVNFMLSDQFLNPLDTEDYSLYIDGVEKEFGLVENLTKTNVLITVYDGSGIIRFDQVVPLKGLSEYNIIISIYNVDFTLTDQFLNPLDISLYSLYIDGVEKEFGLVELTKTDVLITVYDRFGIIGFDSIVDLEGLSEYNIVVPIYKLKIENLAGEIGNITLKEKITQETYDFLLNPDSSRIFKLRSAEYIVIWFNRENLQTYEYTINLISDFNLTLISYIVYFSIFNFDGLGLDDNLVRFYLNGERSILGDIELNMKYNDLLILDFFDNVMYNETIDLSNKTEWNIYVEMYNIEIKNAYNYAIDLVFKRNNLTVEITIPAQFSIEYRFILDVEYNISWYKSSDGSYIGNREITFTKNNLIISFGVSSNISPEPNNDILIWIISIVSIIIVSVLGVFIKYRKQLILYIHKRFKKSGDMDE